ncbi:MAG: HAD family hydrolase, partial [Bacteroidales bacterium]|nr:HAD family hydrolase [Bacteroidales bacterium]
LPLTNSQTTLIKSVLRASNHPLSRMVYDSLKAEVFSVTNFKEKIGSGIYGEINGETVKLGSPTFLNIKEIVKNETAVYVQINGINKGKFRLKNSYRKGVKSVFSQLVNSGYKIVILSGDNEGEKQYLENIVPKGTQLVFQKKPSEKLSKVRKQATSIPKRYNNCWMLQVFDEQKKVLFQGRMMPSRQPKRLVSPW